MLEPAPRNTAPALTIAALTALADAPYGEDPILVVMPADHLITDDAAFVDTLQQAIQHALRDAIVTLGVPPERAETGYGYIKTGLPADGRGARSIERFVEKPAQETAEQYVASGDYWWNSGVFVMRTSVWLAAITAAGRKSPRRAARRTNMRASRATVRCNSIALPSPPVRAIRSTTR
ncbi:hypothetical protein PPGU19_026060 [Paraburkholderia sp. PGU19]|nr:hypothetical protein PPGU19_026060 [Paraburkholderia sp. PGU19]